MIQRNRADQYVSPGGVFVVGWRAGPHRVYSIEHIAQLDAAGAAEAPARSSRSNNGVRRVVATAVHGFEGDVQFHADEQPAQINRRVRETLDE